VNEISKFFKFDLILATWVYPDGFGSLIAAKLLKVPIVVSGHGSDINIYSKYFLRRRIIAYTLKNCQQVIAVSNALKEKMISIGTPEERIQVLLNGVDAGLFKPMDRDKCRAKLGLPHDKKIVLYVGNLEHVKGVDILAQAALDFPQNAILIMVGSGKLKPRLKLTNHMKLVGVRPHDEIPLWMNAADVFCLPSRNEGCPNVLLEALACGTPVIASRTGGIPEIIHSESLGILIFPGDSVALSCAVKEALSREWDRDMLRRSVSGYSWKDNAEKLFSSIGKEKKQLHILYHHRTQGKGGEGVHIREIVRALKNLGHKVFIVNPPGVDVFEEDANIRVATKKTALLANIWSWVSKHTPQIVFEILEICYNVVAAWNIKRVIKRERIDFIYERYAFFSWSGTDMAKRYGIPIILEVNEISGIKRQRDQSLVGLTNKIEMAIFKKANSIIVVSSYLKEEIIKRGIEADKIDVVTNAVDITRFDSGVSDIRVRRLLGLNGKTVLGFVGHFSKWDRIKDLIDTFKEIVVDRPNVHLLLVGDTRNREDRKDIDNLIKNLGLTDSISITGRVDREEMPEYLSTIDMCVIPSLPPFVSPLVLFEYMAMAKTVVMPDIGPTQDVITDGVNGRLFESGDSESMKRTIFDLMDNPDKIKRIGTEARKTVSEKHLWRHNAERIINIYKRIN